MTYLAHHGIIGQKWGVRRYQNEDGSLTPLGEKHVSKTYKESRDKKNYSNYTKKYGAGNSDSNVYVKTSSSNSSNSSNSSGSTKNLKSTTSSSKSTYTIQWGDTLSELAEKYGTTVDRLMALNPQIKDKNLIYAGDKLNIDGSYSENNTESSDSVMKKSTNSTVSSAYKDYVNKCLYNSSSLKKTSDSAYRNYVSKYGAGNSNEVLSEIKKTIKKTIK